MPRPSHWQLQARVVGVHSMARRASILFLAVVAFACGGKKAVSLEDGGVLQLEAECEVNSDCAFGQACVAGICGTPVSEEEVEKPECTTSAECAQGFECVPSLGKCVESHKDNPDASVVFDAGPPPECVEGERVTCGSSKLGECRLGLATCIRDDFGMLVFGPCSGAVEPLPETCDGLDNDCDGIPDDSLPQQTCGTGACQRTVATCEGGAPASCQPGTPNAEVCDGLDNDCDDAIDEEIAPITCGIGACVRTVAACNGTSPNTCTPGASSQEMCNGQDDDCDGVVDDGIGQVTCGLGVCRRTMDACVGGMLQGCMPLPAGTETCNGLDDDCDGLVDEELGTVSCGVGACFTEVAACVNGTQTNCSPGTPGAEVCDGLDNDCDGQSDEELGTVSCGQGLCQNSAPACVSGNPGVCSPLPGSADICDGIDNDCNGTIDPGCNCINGETRACYTGPSGTNGQGICHGGTQTCSGGNWGMCSGQQLPGTETCNGSDDDCDGSVDDGLGTVSCGTGACARTVPVCVGGATNSCMPGPAGSETCNGADDDCDGQVDDGLGTTSCGVGQCARTVAACFNGSTNSCTPGMSAAETCNGFDDDCDGTADEGLGNTTCGVGACVNTVPACTSGAPTSCQPKPAGVETCNGLDDDCDGSIDEGGACNQPPTVTCPGPVTVNPNTSALLSTSASDPNGDTLTCTWSVVSRPPTSNGNFTAVSCGSASYFADVVGVHQVRFTATDPYGGTASCTTTVTVVPQGDLWVELTWDPASDLDLHLQHPNGGNHLTAGGWGNSYDCHYANKTPSWDSPGVIDDPSLDRDDIGTVSTSQNGKGPENIRINLPPTTHDYAVGVHTYAFKNGATSVTATVKVYCNGVLKTTKTKTLTKAKQMWVAGRVWIRSASSCDWYDEQPNKELFNYP